MTVSWGRKLEDCIIYHQFLAKIEDEEAWMSKKLQLFLLPVQQPGGLGQLDGLARTA